MTVAFEDTGSHVTRDSLLARAAARDSMAWGEMVDLYGPLIAHWCGRCGLDTHATADCAQEVFVAVANAIGDFEPRGATGAFRGWLWTITANKVRDRVRREKRAVQGDGGSTAFRRIGEIPDALAVPEEEPTDEIRLNELVNRGLQQVRSEFTEKTWRIFERSVLDNIATAQVAEEFDVKAATVRQARSRVLRRLRQQLGDFGPRDG